MRKFFYSIVILGTFSLLIIPFPAHNEVFKFYGRGHVDPSHPIYGDEFLRTIIKGDKGAIIDVISHYGIVVIRMDLERDSNCDPNELVICFNGKVSKLKNVDHPEVGSEISLKFNLQEGTEEISIHTGDMAGTNVLVFLENIGDRKNHNDTGNLHIDWQSCQVEFDKESGLPIILKIIPQVLDDSNKLITSDITSKFRFSYDSKIEESSHVHLDYSIIDEFLIEPKNPQPIILNLTKAFIKAENFTITSIQIESRHYTIFPSNNGEPISYNNEDQIVVEISFENGKWFAKQGLCKNITLK